MVDVQYTQTVIDGVAGDRASGLKLADGKISVVLDVAGLAAEQDDTAVAAAVTLTSR